MRSKPFSDITEIIVFSERLISVSRDKDNGLDSDLYSFLTKLWICCIIFEQDNGPEEALQAALMWRSHGS
jgi:hypothetical protein